MRFAGLFAVVVASAASCATAPAPIDVAALVAKRGPEDARRDLAIRVVADPRDIQARLGLAALADRLGRPSEAIAALEVVQGLGGPLGPRWHDDDRARLARLLLARGRARLVRGAAAAATDLTRAADLGARVSATELVAGRAARALAQLRHVDADERTRGRATLAALGDATWAGATATATPAEHAAFGEWAWSHGARREAYDQLAAWHAAAVKPHDEHLQMLYLRARAWWSPVWLAGPALDERDLFGAEACRVTCDPTTAFDDPDAEHALLAAPMITRSSNPDAALALAAITLRASLRGEGSWGRLVFARVDTARLPKPLAAFAHLAGRREPAPGDGELVTATGASVTASERLVTAADRALAGGSVASVRAALGALADTADGRAILAIVEPAPSYAGTDARADGAVRFARSRVIAIVTAYVAVPVDQLDAAGVPPEAALTEIARAFRRDPAVAERLGRELVARSIDVALGHATVGALFDALGDPARARLEWQAAADASDEPALVAGLAEAIARTGDGDAALVIGTGAAAASGDPAAVWVSIARALLDTHRTVNALTAARSAIDLAGPDTIGDALDIAIEASELTDRKPQVAALTARRARVAPPSTNDHVDDPTDAIAARQALAQLGTASTIARAWVASRWNPRDVELRAALLVAIAPDDPRRGALVAELVALAGDPDRVRALDAALALR